MTDRNGHSEGFDAGADRDTRVKPCAITTWCFLELGHAGPCEEVPRTPHPKPDYGPGRKR